MGLIQQHCPPTKGGEAPERDGDFGRAALNTGACSTYRIASIIPAQKVVTPFVLDKTILFLLVP